MTDRRMPHPTEMPTQTEILSMSGFDFMRGVLEGHFAAPPISIGLNYRLTAVKDGSVTFTGTPRFEHSNPGGTVHGGWYGTLLDSAMACAVMTKVPKGSHYTTLEYKVNILRPIAFETEVEAIGTVQHAGRSTGVANGEIRGKTDGRLFATGTTTCLIMKV